MPGPSGRHKSHAFRSTTEFSSLQSICGLHSSREVGHKGPKCFTPDPRDLVPGTYQRCQHCPEHADDCLYKGKDGLRCASLMFALIGNSGWASAAGGYAWRAASAHRDLTRSLVMVRW